MTMTEDEYAKQEQRVLTKVIMTTPPGPDLDKMMAMSMFETEVAKCDVDSSGMHIVGSFHFISKVAGDKRCSNSLPKMSTDLTLYKIVVEWITQRYDSIEILFDSNSWYCNIATKVKEGQWVRVAHTVGFSGMQEAVCKAALLAKIAPRTDPLVIRTTADLGVSEPKKRRKKK